MSPVTHARAFDLHEGSPSGGLPVLRAVQSPRSVRVLAALLAALVVLVVIGLVVTPWQQSITGTGRVIAVSPLERQQRLEAPVDGRVVAVHFSEGRRGQTGDVVVDIGDVDPRFLERLESERSLVRLRQDAAEARRGQVLERIAALEQARTLGIAAAEARLDMAKERARQAEQAVAAAEATRLAAEQNLPRVRSLADQGLRSTREKELAELDASRAAADEERARATLAAARSEVDSLVAERGRVDKDTTAGIRDARGSSEVVNAEVAAAAAELVRLETRIARQQTQAVQLPRDAVVLRVLVQEGQLVKQGDPLVDLVPDTVSRAVEIWVDGNDAPLVTPGREVRLQFEGWPALQFVGWPQAARGTFGGQVALIDSHDDGTGRFRVVVVPMVGERWPHVDVLRQGVRANGWVLLEQVRLGWELWRRLNAFPPTLSTAPQTLGEPTGKPDAAGGKASAGAKQ